MPLRSAAHKRLSGGRFPVTPNTDPKPKISGHRLASLALSAVLFSAFGLACAHAQSASSNSQDSLADAARKAREQKKEAPKQAKVFTNEDLGDLKGTVSVVGEAAAPADADKVADGKAAPADAKAPAAEAKAQPAGDAKPEARDEAYWRKKFDDARRTLTGDAKELDVLQREFNLKQQQYYSDPNVALREQNDRKDLDSTQDQINTKKAAVDKDNQALADLQDDLRKAGGDPGWANPVTSAP